MHITRRDRLTLLDRTLIGLLLLLVLLLLGVQVAKAGGAATDARGAARCLVIPTTSPVS